MLSGPCVFSDSKLAKACVMRFYVEEVHNLCIGGRGFSI